MNATQEAPGTQVVVVDPAKPVGSVPNLRKVIAQQWKTIAAVLPAHFQGDRFGALVVSLAARNPKVLACTGISILDAMYQAASLGLEINAATGEAYLIPFRDNRAGVSKAQLVPGYKGLVKLAMRAPEVVAVEARLVYEGESFRVHYGTDSRIEHEPNFEIDRDPDTVLFAYGVGKMAKGGTTFEVMTRKQLDAIRARSKSKDDGPWVTDREEMYRKTVARRVCKYLPMTAQLAEAIELVDRAETGDFDGKGAPSVGAVALNAALNENGSASEPAKASEPEIPEGRFEEVPLADGVPLQSPPDDAKPDDITSLPPEIVEVITAKLGRKGVTPAQQKAYVAFLESASPSLKAALRAKFPPLNIPV